MTLRSKRLWVLSAVCAFGVLVVYWLAVRTELGQRIDEAALSGRGAVPDEFVADAWTILDFVGVVSLIATIGVLWAVSLYRGRPELVIAVTAAIVGANVTTQVLKRVVLTRPNLIEEAAFGVNSLPSGHTTVAASVAFGLVLVATARWRTWAALVAAVYASTVGVATMTAGWHRPSDAIAAILVAGAWTAAASAIVGGDEGDPGSFAPAVLWLTGIGAIVVTVGSAGAWAALRMLEDGSLVDRLESGFAHVTAGAGIAVTGVVTAAALVLASSLAGSAKRSAAARGR